MKAVLLLITLFWSLVEVHSQTVPYVSFMGEILPNHGYVDLTLVGDPVLSSAGDPIQCHTDLEACCSGLQGPDHRGDWYFPDGDRLPFPGEVNITEARGAQRVELRRNSGANSPSGIYRCDIPTDDDDISVRETVYVGVYATGGDITISDDVTLTVDSGDSPQFTLTYISTGGPATTVTWTRDSVTVTEGTETVLDDPVTAQYTHTLTGSTAGVYTCTVANEKPSSDSASITVEGPSAPTNVTAVQEGPTSIRVSWTPSSDATGYRIDYTSSDGSSDSVTVSGGSTDNYLLTGLQNGETYTISIVATLGQSISDPSPSVHVRLYESELSLCATISVTDQLIINIVSISATSISLSWCVPSGSVVTSSEVMWREASSGTSEGTSGSLTDTSYTIDQLESTTIYTITVTVSNTAGSTDSQPITVTTVQPITDSCSQTEDNNGGVIGAVVVAVIFMITTAVAVTVIVILVFRGKVSVPDSTNKAIEMSKFSRETMGPDDVIQTSSNEAYHTVTQTGGGRGRGDVGYETVSANVPPSTSTSTQPTAGDTLYESV